MVALPATWKQRREKPEATKRYPHFLAGVGGNVDGGSRTGGLGCLRIFHATAVCQNLTRMVDERAKGYEAPNRRWERIANKHVSTSTWKRTKRERALDSSSGRFGAQA